MKITRATARIKLDRNLYLCHDTGLKLPCKESLGRKFVQQLVTSALENFDLIDVADLRIYLEQQPALAVESIAPEFGGYSG